MVQLYRGQGIRWYLNPLLNIMALRAIFLRGIFKHFQEKSNFRGSWSHEYLPKKSGLKKSGCVKTSNRNSHQACWGASWYSIRNHGFKISKKTLCSKKMLWLGRTCHMPYNNVVRCYNDNFHIVRGIQLQNVPMNLHIKCSTFFLNFLKIVFVECLEF